MTVVIVTTSRTFKRMFGLPPSALQRRSRVDDEP
jgi:hypothetical protein